MNLTEDKSNLLAGEALEDFATIQEKLPYGIASTIGSALGKLQNLEKAEQEGRLIKSPCKVGDMVYVIDYEEHEVIGYVFVANNDSCVSASPRIYGYENELISEYLIEDTQQFEGTDIYAFPISHVFTDRQEAEKALESEGE